MFIYKHDRQSVMFMFIFLILCLKAGKLFVFQKFVPNKILAFFIVIHDAMDKVFGQKMLLSEIIWRLKVQSQLQVSITRNTYYGLTLGLGHG